MTQEELEENAFRLWLNGFSKGLKESLTEHEELAIKTGFIGGFRFSQDLAEVEAAKS